MNPMMKPVFKVLVIFSLLMIQISSASASEAETERIVRALNSSIESADKSLNCEATVKTETLDVGQGETLPAIVVHVKRPGMRDLKATSVGPVEVTLVRYKPYGKQEFQFQRLYKLNLIDSENADMPDRINWLTVDGKLWEMSRLRATANLDGKGPSYGPAFSLCSQN